MLTTYITIYDEQSTLALLIGLISKWKIWIAWENSHQTANESNGKERRKNETQYFFYTCQYYIGGILTIWLVEIRKQFARFYLYWIYTVFCVLCIMGFDFFRYTSVRILHRDIDEYTSKIFNYLIRYSHGKVQSSTLFVHWIDLLAPFLRHNYMSATCTINLFFFYSCLFAFKSIHICDYLSAIGLVCAHYLCYVLRIISYHIEHVSVLSPCAHRIHCRILICVYTLYNFVGWTVFRAIIHINPITELYSL